MSSSKRRHRQNGEWHAPSIFDPPSMVKMSYGVIMMEVARGCTIMQASEEASEGTPLKMWWEKLERETRTWNVTIWAAFEYELIKKVHNKHVEQINDDVFLRTDGVEKKYRSMIRWLTNTNVFNILWDENWTKSRFKSGIWWLSVRV